MSVISTVQDASPSETVIEKVASRKGVEPSELDTPLFDAVDPDALDMLVRSISDDENQSALRIEFTYDGYSVLVASDGSVRVSPSR